MKIVLLLKSKAIDDFVKYELARKY